jgi:cytochrome P450
MRLLATDEAAVEARPGTAAAEKFKPFDAEYLQDPYAVLSELQRIQPTFYSRELSTWVVTRHESVRAVLRDPKQFSARIASDPLRALCPAARSIIQDSSFDVPRLLVNNDPPAHTRLRRFMATPLRPERFQSLEGYVREVVDLHVDRMISATQPLDLVKCLTWDVPALVLFKLIGIPDSDVERVKTWATSRVVLTWGQPSDAQQTALAGSAVEYYEYAVNLVHRKVNNLSDDYISDLIRLRDGDDAKATLHEITVQVFNLLFAGHETTSSAAANMFLAVLRRPAIWNELCNGKLATSDIVEEALRFDSPVQGWRRLALVDVELDGQKIAAGAHLLLMLSAANRDPARFATPDDFCPARDGAAGHLTFGAGIHFCLGAPLARLELSVMLEIVASRLPSMRMLPDQDIPYVPNTALRGAGRLMVTCA